MGFELHSYGLAICRGVIYVLQNLACIIVASVLGISSPQRQGKVRPI